MTLRYAAASLALLLLWACDASDRSVQDNSQVGPDAQLSDRQDESGRTAQPTGDVAGGPSDRGSTPAATPYGDRASIIPGLIEAEHYDQGAPGVAYHDKEPKNQGADYRGATQVDIEKRDDASNGHGIGWTRAGEWVTYTVDVLEAGEYVVEFPVASNKQGGIFHLEIDAVDITGPIEVPDTGGWQILKTISAQTSRLEQGPAVIKMVMDSQGESGSIGDIDSLRFIRAKP